MNSRIQTTIFTYLLLFSAGAISEIDRSRISIRCVDADTAEALPCKITRMQADSSNGSDVKGYITIDLIDPVIVLQLTATSPKYSTRQVSILPIRLKDSWQSNRDIALPRRLDPTTSANLSSINKVRTLAEAGKFDQALATMEEIERDLTIANRNGTFFARFMYWRSVVAFRACTRLSYGLCTKAKDLLKELQNAIDENPSTFTKEKVDNRQVNDMLQQLEVAEFNQAVARAEWLKRVGKYEEAVNLFENVRNELSARGESFQAKVSYSEALAKNEIVHITTLRAMMDNR